MADLELLTVGRISVDLYAEQLRVPLREVRDVPQVDRGHRHQRRRRRAPDWDIARRCSRALGDDPFGEYVRDTLEDTFGVDTRFVGTDPDAADTARVRHDGAPGRAA